MDNRPKDPLEAFTHILQSVLTASYLGAYRYYTLEPIKEIEQLQNAEPKDALREALVVFRHAKKEELAFVSTAVGSIIFYNPSTIPSSHRKTR
jgi:hypothetical protein